MDFKKNKKIFKSVFYIILELCMIFSILYILKYCYDIYSIKKESNLLNEIAVENTVEDENIEPQNTENIEKEEDKKEVKTERMVKVEKLQKDNSDIVGWIQIENTNINYPVLQASDNSFYLTHNYKKQYSINGSIFLDKDYIWNPPSSNLLMYGHDMLLKVFMIKILI